MGRTPDLVEVMPRGPRGEKRPADVIGNAVHVMRIATGEIQESADQPLFSRGAIEASFDFTRYALAQMTLPGRVSKGKRLRTARRTDFRSFGWYEKAALSIGISARTSQALTTG
jgi:hypothetical protein